MLRSTCRPIALSAVLLGVALLLAQTTAQSCSVRYQSSGRPLLFGGVNEPGRCQKGCHRVNDYWTSACQFRLGQTWGSCNEQQIAKTLGEMSVTAAAAAVCSMTDIPSLPTSGICSVTRKYCCPGDASTSQAGITADVDYACS